MKFEIWKATDSQFYFHLKARNGKIILASEGYKDKRSASKAIAAIKKSASAKILHKV